MGTSNVSYDHPHSVHFGAGAGTPKPMKSIATAEGAHRIAFTLDGRGA